MCNVSQIGSFLYAHIHIQFCFFYYYYNLNFSFFLSMCKTITSIIWAETKLKYLCARWRKYRKNKRKWIGNKSCNTNESNNLHAHSVLARQKISRSIEKYREKETSLTRQNGKNDDENQYNKNNNIKLHLIW